MSASDECFYIILKLLLTKKSKNVVKILEIFTGSSHWPSSPFFVSVVEGK